MTNNDSYNIPDVTLYRLNEIKALQCVEELYDNKKIYYLLIYYGSRPISIGYINKQKRDDIYFDLKERLKDI